MVPKHNSVKCYEESPNIFGEIPHFENLNCGFSIILSAPSNGLLRFWSQAPKQIEHGSNMKVCMVKSYEYDINGTYFRPKKYH